MEAKANGYGWPILLNDHHMGTGWEILPILEVDGLPVGDGKMGPVANAVDRLYHDLVRGIDPCHADWRTPVY